MKIEVNLGTYGDGKVGTKIVTVPKRIYAGPAWLFRLFVSVVCWRTGWRSWHLPKA